MQKKYEAAEKNRIQLLGDLDRTREELTAAEKALAKFDNDRNALNNEVAELRSQIVSQRTNSEALQRQSDNLTERLSAVQKELAEKQDANSNSAAANKELTDKLADTLSHLKKLEKSQRLDSQRAAERIAELEQKVTAGQSQLRSMEQAVQEAEINGRAIKEELSQVNHELKKQNTGVIIITHYHRILKHITPDYVHVMLKGKIVDTGAHNLAKRIEKKGYKQYESKSDI